VNAYKSKSENNLTQNQLDAFFDSPIANMELIKKTQLNILQSLRQIEKMTKMLETYKQIEYSNKYEQ
jgi:hypothetical protein